MVRDRSVSVSIDVDAVGELQTSAKWGKVGDWGTTGLSDTSRVSSVVSRGRDDSAYPPAMILAISTPSRFFSDSVSVMLMGIPMTTHPDNYDQTNAK